MCFLAAADPLRSVVAGSSWGSGPKRDHFPGLAGRGFGLAGLLGDAAELLARPAAQIGFGRIYDELKQADPAWFAIVLLLAQASFIGKGVAVRGAVAAPLPLLRASSCKPRSSSST
jgi:hypothetical protein